jgi:short subunit dehydrogenase-like uncharacterized protein
MSAWMLYGAAGYTGSLIAQHAHVRGHRPLLAGRSEPALAALAGRLDLLRRTVSLADPAALRAALAGVDLVLNAAGPFVHTAAPLAAACLDAGVHYLDIGNELQVFAALYDLDERARRAGVAVIPGTGFGVVATNCLAGYVSDAVGGAQALEVAARAATAQPGPGIAASVRENLPYGGWTRRTGRLHPQPLGSGITTVAFPDGPCQVMPFPTGDLEAAFLATGAPDITAYSPVPADLVPAPAGPHAPAGTGAPAGRSFGWARATGPDGAVAQAVLETGESYAFTAAASIRAVEETLTRSPRGALSPATAFGSDFALTIPDTTRIDAHHLRGSTAGLERRSASGQAPAQHQDPHELRQSHTCRPPGPRAAGSILHRAGHSRHDASPCRQRRTAGGPHARYATAVRGKPPSPRVASGKVVY